MWPEAARHLPTTLLTRAQLKDLLAAEVVIDAALALLLLG
jgi:hypothetical protein